MEKESNTHSQRVKLLCYEIALNMGMNEEAAFSIASAAYFHDIGKSLIPDQILNKPGKLTQEEYACLKTHTVSGYTILRKYNSPIMRLSAEIALLHHERLDGQGYPCGISGNSISLPVRMVTVADVFDALTSERAYRAAWPVSKALAYIHNGIETAFDKNVVSSLVNTIQRKIRHEYAG